MHKILSLLKILFIERRLPSKAYAFLKKLGFKIRTRKVCTKDGLVLKGFDSYFFVLDQIEEYKSADFTIEKGMNIIDIGANQGFFTVFAAGRGGANVYAFEPDKNNYKILLWNIKRNKLNSQVKSFNVAVSNKDDFVKLFIPLREKEGDYRSSLISTSKAFVKEEKKFQGCKTELVKSISLNSFLDETLVSKWDFVKIDCEGAEYEILTCLSKENLAKIKRIAMETHAAGHDDKELARFLQEAGFKIVYFKEIAGNNTGFIKAVRND